MTKNIIAIILFASLVTGCGEGKGENRGTVDAVQAGAMPGGHSAHVPQVEALSSNRTALPTAEPEAATGEDSSNKGQQVGSGPEKSAEAKTQKAAENAKPVSESDESDDAEPGDDVEDTSGSSQAEDSQQPASGESAEQVEKVDLNEAQTAVDEKLKAYLDACDRVFKIYVDENGDVDYALLRRKRIDLIEAHRLLTGIRTEEYHLLYTRDEKIAFWINTHNLLTLELIVDNYPIQPRWYMITYPDTSIMQIPGGRDKVLFEIWEEKTEQTLQEIEKRLMVKFNDLRICFALSYASKGSAFLRNEAYWPARLDEQLNDQVKRFVESDRGVVIDTDSNSVKLSDVFNRYRDEFSNSKYAEIQRFRKRSDFVRACLNFILEYVGAEESKFLLGKDFNVTFMIYDWHLNEQAESK